MATVENNTSRAGHSDEEQPVGSPALIGMGATALSGFVAGILLAILLGGFWHG
jgi:hypothetical protein